MPAWPFFIVIPEQVVLAGGASLLLSGLVTPSTVRGRMPNAGYDETTMQLLVPILGNSALELLEANHLAQLIY